MAHRRFADTAGDTRHCWECIHAKNWHSFPDLAVHFADCELTGRKVGKYQSPNNPFCHLQDACNYETR